MEQKIIHPTECLRADKFEAITESIKDLKTAIEKLNKTSESLNHEIISLNYFKFKIIGATLLISTLLPTVISILALKK